MGRCLTIVNSIVHWLFFTVTIVFLISGLGVYYARQISTLTFGLLNKPLSLKLHIYLWVPFTILLLFHVITTIMLKKHFTKQR